MNALVDCSDYNYFKITSPIFCATDISSLSEVVATTALKLSTANYSAVYIFDHSKNQYVAEAMIGADGVNRKNTMTIIQQEMMHKKSYKNFILEACRTAYPVVIERQDPNFIDVASVMYVHDTITGKKTGKITIYPLIAEPGTSIGFLLLTAIEGPAGKIQDKSIFPTEDFKHFSGIAANLINNLGVIKKNQRLVEILNRTTVRLRDENKKLKSQVFLPIENYAIIGNSSDLRNVFTMIEKVVNSDVTVLVLGETGTGKELIAHALHEKSHRRNNNFVVQNCAAIPETLLESELFGYKKGAFSGAIADKKGLIEQADKGTLFLDEIGELPYLLQAKLLRVLQDKVIRPVGSNSNDGVKVDVRIVAATHCDLKKKVEEGSFRQDLYYRLAVFPLKLPPLRERREDIPALVEYFLKIFSQKYNKKISGITPLVLNILVKYSYPGNIRDLKNIIERSVLLTDDGGNIDYSVLGDDILGDLHAHKYRVAEPQETKRKSLKQKIEDYEERLIKEKLKECNWNQTKAARELKIARRTIIEKIQKYHINKYITDIDSTLQ